MSEINSEKLKTAWLRQLREEWKSANYNHFKNTMRLPNLRLSQGVKVLGQWKGEPYRALSISSHLIRHQPWEDVQEVLYHEMAHQYVAEVMGIRDEAPHGPTFKIICLENGIDPSATGTLQSWGENRYKRRSVNSKNNKLFATINKLMALAQSPNEHEARSAMTKAHQLLLKHNLSLLDLKTQQCYIHKQVGAVGRRNPIKSMISSILGQFFFVETLWVFGYAPHEDRTGRVLEIYGTPENVEMAEYVYHTLENVSERSWAEHKREQKISGNRHRRTFIVGLLEGFYQKLDGRVIENQSQNLVWKGDPQLTAFYRRRNPRVIRAASRYSKSSKDAHRSGIAQGNKLVIHKGIYSNGQGKMKLLN